MKVLWLCNIVLPDFSTEFGLKKNYAGGWMTGMLHQLKNCNDITIAVCTPIIDSQRAKDGICDGYRYYSFSFGCNDYQEEVKERFKVILADYKPDVIHIWGTEYPHTLEMVNACQEFNLLDKVVINIQGLVSVYAQHYYAGIPEQYRRIKSEGYHTLEWEYDDFVHRGKYEIEALRKVQHVIGRTDWDEACATRINSKIQYHFCNETLREEFYLNAGTWSYEGCEKHAVFISQAGYPIKGFHYLLKTMPDVLKSYPDAHIYVGGYDITSPNQNGKIRPYGHYIRSLLEEYHLSGHITFLGKLDGQEMVAQYRRANVFVSPSSIENSSNSIQEAVSIGCPVVASYVGGTAHYVRSGENGYLYQSDAEYMLGFYIKKVFAQQEYRCKNQKMQANKHSSRNLQTLLQVYNMLVET
mgnify:CR=1 FL=1